MPYPLEAIKTSLLQESSGCSTPQSRRFDMTLHTGRSALNFSPVKLHKDTTFRHIQIADLYNKIHAYDMVNERVCLISNLFVMPVP